MTFNQPCGMECDTVGDGGDGARRAVARWIEGFHNPWRRRSLIGNQPPADFENFPPHQAAAAAAGDAAQLAGHDLRATPAAFSARRRRGLRVVCPVFTCVLLFLPLPEHCPGRRIRMRLAG